MIPHSISTEDILSNAEEITREIYSTTVKVSKGSLEGVADEVTANARIEPEGPERRLMEC